MCDYSDSVDLNLANSLLLYYFSIGKNNRAVFVSLTKREVLHPLDECSAAFLCDTVQERYDSTDSIKPGAIFDAASSAILATPRVRTTIHLVDELPTDNRICVIDATTVHLSYVHGRWLISTKNSFDISPMCEYKKTYKRYFEESCARVGTPIKYDQLDPTKTYTITFSNPNIHATATEHRAYCWNEDLVIGEPLIGQPEFGYVEQDGANLDVYLLRDFAEMTQEAYENRNALGSFGAHVWTMVCNDAAIIPHFNAKFADKASKIRNKLPLIRTSCYMTPRVNNIGIPFRFQRAMSDIQFKKMAYNPKYAQFIARLADSFSE